MKITVTFEAPSAVAEEQAYQLLLESLYQYTLLTGPTALDFINQRYPLGSYTREFREARLQEVMSNRDMARTLRQAIIETRRVESSPSIEAAVQDYCAEKGGSTT